MTNLHTAERIYPEKGGDCDSIQQAIDKKDYGSLEKLMTVSEAECLIAEVVRNAIDKQDYDSLEKLMNLPEIGNLVHLEAERLIPEVVRDAIDKQDYDGLEKLMNLPNKLLREEVLDMLDVCKEQNGVKIFLGRI